MKENSKIVSTKRITYKGKSYIISLTEEQMNELRKNAEICKLNGHDFEYFINQMLSLMMRKDWPEMAAVAFKEANPELSVGMGATMHLYSDHRAMTIIDIVSPKEIVVAENETKCLDYFGGDYEILPTLKNYMRQSVFTLRKNGTWVEKGQPKKYGSVTLTVGFRRHYIDPSF